MPSHIHQRRLALEAARLMVQRIETEYLHAKERAILMLGLPYNTPYPTNRQIKEYIGKLTREKMGAEAMAGQVRAMRENSAATMTPNARQGRRRPRRWNAYSRSGVANRGDDASPAILHLPGVDLRGPLARCRTADPSRVGSHVAGQTSHARCTCDQPLILRALNLPLPGGEQPVWIGQCAHCHLIYVELRAEFHQTTYGGWKGSHEFRFDDLFRC